MEVGHAVARQGMRREQADEIANRLLEKYEDRAATVPLGKQYQECYDVAKSLSIPEHLDMFNKVKEDIAEMGVEFLY